MPNFIERLSEQIEDNKKRLRATFIQGERPEEIALKRLVEKHWHRLPVPTELHRFPAYAVDGSRSVRHLSNGANLFVAQALILGEANGQRTEGTKAGVEILPGATESSFVNRFAELMMHQLEANLARECLRDIPRYAVILLDGSLYGQLPHLFKYKDDSNDSEVVRKTKELINGIVDDILKCYQVLFDGCRDGLTLVSIAKTTTESIHSTIWQSRAGIKTPLEICDSEVIYRWTGKAAGYSTPILLGKRSFWRGERTIVIEDESVRRAPAILSFFVRLADFDDALRIDVPASCIGRNETIDDIESGHEILLDQSVDLAAIEKILQLLISDYGGPEVYNALMYSVDREVRLRQDMMDEVYLSLIQNTLGPDVELRLDRSERRFH